MTAPKIKADIENGEGGVVFTKEWNALDPLMRADILRDVLCDVSLAYQRAMHDLESEWEETRINLNRRRKN